MLLTANEPVVALHTPEVRPPPKYNVAATVTRHVDDNAAQRPAS
jgi:hypothetical protein